MDELLTNFAGTSSCVLSNDLLGHFPNNRSFTVFTIFLEAFFNALGTYRTFGRFSLLSFSIGFSFALLDRSLTEGTTAGAERCVIITADVCDIKAIGLSVESNEQIDEVFPW